MGGRLPPEVAAWVPNIVMSVGAIGLDGLAASRRRSADSPDDSSLRAAVDGAAVRSATAQDRSDQPARPFLVVRIPRLDLPRRG